MKPGDSLTYLKGVGEKRSKLFEKLGVFTVGDLLTYYPRDYIDFTDPVPIKELDLEEFGVFGGVVTKKLHPYIGRQYSIYRAVVSDADDSVLLTFFNSEYAFARLTEGRNMFFTEKSRGRFWRRNALPRFLSALPSGTVSSRNTG